MNSVPTNKSVYLSLNTAFSRWSPSQINCPSKWSPSQTKEKTKQNRKNYEVCFHAEKNGMRTGMKKCWK